MTDNNNTNMEQHINKLIEAAIKKTHLKQTTIKLKRQQVTPNFAAKKQQTGERKTKTGQHPPKHNPKVPPKNKANSEKEKQSKQPEEPPNTKKRIPTKPPKTSRKGRVNTIKDKTPTLKAERRETEEKGMERKTKGKN
jgi:hypothetical protein